MSAANYITLNPTGGLRIYADPDRAPAPGTPVNFDELEPSIDTDDPAYEHGSGTQGPPLMAVTTDDINTAIHRSLRWAKFRVTADITITPASSAANVVPEAAFVLGFDFVAESVFADDDPGPDFCDGKGENAIAGTSQNLTSLHILYAVYSDGSSSLQPDGELYLEEAAIDFSIGRYVYVYDDPKYYTIIRESPIPI